MKKFLCLILVVVFAFSLLCSCSSSNSSYSSNESTTSEEDLVKKAVEARIAMFYNGGAIGGNELVNSFGTITNVKRVSSIKYSVSGQISAKDKYGTIWRNTFDIDVEKNSSGSWRAGSFEFTNSSWSK